MNPCCIVDDYVVTLMISNKDRKKRRQFWKSLQLIKGHVLVVNPLYFRVAP